MGYILFMNPSANNLNVYLPSTLFEDSNFNHVVPGWNVKIHNIATNNYTLNIFDTLGNNVVSIGRNVSAQPILRDSNAYHAV
jgi:hypothetical protein